MSYITDDYFKHQVGHLASFIEEMLAALSSVVTGSLKLSQLDHRALDEGSERGCKVDKVMY